MISKNHTSQNFQLHNSDFDKEKIQAVLSERYSLVKNKPGNSVHLYYDTFDWRLYNRGFLLVREGNIFKLTDINETIITSTLKVSTKDNFKFWQDFPESALRDQIKPIIDIRALIPRLKLSKQNQVAGILNDDQKTVVRLNFQKVSLPRGKSKIFICNNLILLPVRGYEKELTDIERFLKLTGLKTTENNIFTLGLGELDLKPGSYSSKIRLDLKGYMSSRTAAILIFRDLLSTMKLNERGIKDDIDIEFLHDFRVAIRRTRSALSQIKGIFPDKDVNKFKTDFSKAGKMSNKLRDLDVYLLAEEKYKKMLTPDFHGGLELIFNILRKERKKEQAKVSRYLDSAGYKKILKTWEGYLDTEPAPSLNSEKPISDLAREFIRKKYIKIMKTGSRIDDETPDPVLHSLRIECKKLRYLLEFFSSIFPSDDITFIVKHFKKLQDNLGDFNDLHVQQESLKLMLNEFKVGQEDLAKISMSIGGLVAVLNQKQKEVRKDFNKSFEEISNDKYVILFNKLFSPEGN